MKKAMIALMISACAIAYAETNAVGKAKGKVNAKEALQRVYNQKLGGFVTKPGSKQGCIRFVNAQSKLSASEIEAVIKTIKTQMKHDIALCDGKAPTALPTADDIAAVKATLAVFVVDSPTLPVQLVAPDDRWAIVNVAKLSEGIKDDAVGKRIFARRARGEIIRTFSLLCGGGTSMYPGNIFTATSVKSMDSLTGDAMVVDMVPRYENYLKNIGVMPAYTVTYSRACMEGWAPPPTNEFQKAVAERVRAKLSKEPTKGMKIEYDPKTGR